MKESHKKLGGETIGQWYRRYLGINESEERLGPTAIRTFVEPFIGPRTFRDNFNL
jgi:hypothetical protein